MTKPITVDYKPASQVVRAAAKSLDRMVFNDRLKDGGRSIKIWGAGKSTYLPIKRKLETLGYTVSLKNLGKSRWTVDNRDCYRIHVR
jgi:hypothetical protein